ncbi:hypothetical protein DUNSADRAFT_10107 [Dunaliella salina]|uniref:Uncharacterized protein n=1 Tax=Dunaliella salina TaxID=3046 RepID=A0ABQ7H505_DUNSA|nr:hypothetical protein DUNSADRAFT_10107 [Dunaliella salina]|eukprot:KAF5841937.1 hypothetical protein DUNSADRAFT_10107 [Dunaliella salina]
MFTLLAAAAAKREAAALELQEQLNKQLAGHARERSAARCIERAWMRYSGNPGGRARRAAHVAVLQAAWRARDIRIMFTHMRAQHRVLLSVEAAVSAADTNGLQSALQEAEALAAREILWASPLSFIFPPYAAQEAQRFAPLQPRIAAATATFEERCRSAEAALDAAVADSPMQGVLDQRRRLLALQQRQALQRLQPRPQEELQGQAEAERDALNVTALIEEARVLGLDAEADALQQRLSARQHSLHAKIMSAAEHSTPAGLAALLRVASSWGLGADLQSTAQRVMADRRVRAVEELQRQSAEGSLTGFKRARCEVEL